MSNDLLKAAHNALRVWRMGGHADPSEVELARGTLARALQAPQDTPKASVGVEGPVGPCVVLGGALEPPTCVWRGAQVRVDGGTVVVRSSGGSEILLTCSRSEAVKRLAMHHRLVASLTRTRALAAEGLDNAYHPTDVCWDDDEKIIDEAGALLIEAMK